MTFPTVKNKYEFDYLDKKYVENSTLKQRGTGKDDYYRALFFFYRGRQLCRGPTGNPSNHQDSRRRQDRGQERAGRGKLAKNQSGN